MYSFYLLAITTTLALAPTGALAFQVGSSLGERNQKRVSLQATALSSSDTTETTPTAEKVASRPKEKSTKRVSLLICPAQFCVPDDYQVLFDNLRRSEFLSDNDDIEIGATVVAPLPRTEWIKVARQLPTRNFWDATLPVHKTLSWYFDAMETGLAEILASEGPDANICIIGHSIGGWVARAYLGGLSR